MKLRNATLSLLGAASLLAASNVSAEDAGPTGPLDISNFSMSIWGTTEYMFRGISNTDGPAIQSSLDWTYNGFYLGVWGSNTEFSDEDIEIDFYGGYRWSMLGLGFDVAALYYTFPGEDEDSSDSASDNAYDPGIGVEADYLELQLIVSKSWDVAFSPSAAVKYNYSPDIFGEDGDGHAVQGDFGVIVPMAFLGDIGLSGSVGYQDIEGDNFTVGYDYAWYRFGAYRDIAGFKVDVSYFGTDMSDDLQNFAYPDSYTDDNNLSNLIEPHLVLTVSRSFSF